MVGAATDREAREAAARFLTNRGFRVAVVVGADEVFSHREGNA